MTTIVQNEVPVISAPEMITPSTLNQATTLKTNALLKMDGQTNCLTGFLSKQTN